MAKPSFLLTVSFLLAFHLLASQSQPVEHRPNGHIHTPLPPTKVMNTIDSCWRTDPNWQNNRKALANCAKGFGSGAKGGQNGQIYIVINPSDDPINPKPGTIRHGVIQTGALWITFQRDMNITLHSELIVTNDKTIDGRGVKIEIVNGPCLTLSHVSHVIIHGISIHDCKPAAKDLIVRDNGSHVTHRIGSDGDAITIYGSSNIWIDHCYLAHSTDGLIDITHASTDVTVSNNYFTQHDKVMLLGHNDGFAEDKIMKVTVAFNHFGPGLIERMPRVRYGYAHVANNKYCQWQNYAIGGSAGPTILSEGNLFIASEKHKQVTKREVDLRNDVWKSWTWKSSKDMLLHGAEFEESGLGNAAPVYSKNQAFDVAEGSTVPSLIADAGPLHCVANRPCS